MDETAFRQRLQRDGYGEPELFEREANLRNDMHTHEFSACALVIEGEVSVVTETGRTTCRAGDTFELAGGIPHREEYGPHGARFLLGRRTG